MTDKKKPPEASEGKATDKKISIRQTAKSGDIISRSIAREITRRSKLPEPRETPPTPRITKQIITCQSKLPEPREIPPTPRITKPKK
jgi:hypothetical protein